jgi:hypothetical protein
LNTAIAIFQRSELTVTKTDGVDFLIESALSRSALIGKVETPEENVKATEALKSIKSVLKQIEDARKATKEPGLEFCWRVDGLAKQLASELEPEALRVANLQSEFAAEELLKAREAEQLRAAELDKVEADTSIPDELKAQAMEAVGPPVSIAKAAGQTVRETWEFIVTDIWLLARMSPGLVRITPNTQEINDTIAKLAMSGEPKIPGLSIKKAVKVGVRLDKTTTVDV